jgi:hypothetical protein
MSEDVKTDRRGYPGTRACLGKRPLLVRDTPRLAIAATEYVHFARAAGRKAAEQSAPFIRQHDVTHLSSL